ncbi:MFS transporter [Actinoplanes sp. N902-109]|uniref:MFS transporter n=1 Tax=Actinoplanes sp. (strain N902-109) TaxID=649831 RepID=UPI0003295DB4|nr:MFS transporter [Actinoplanes sp. N902-109]AGL17344.1 arabinose efflux permease family protein [Actinoplanes sp. N902-109]
MTGPTVLICAMIATSQLTWGAVVPVLPLFLDRYGMSGALLGTVVTAFGAGRVLANIPAGLALRRLPTRAYLRTLMLALAVVTALTGPAHSAPTLIGMRLLAGILGGAAVTVGFAVLVAGAPAGRRGAVMATATVVQLSAAAAGSVLGGAVVGVVGPAWTFPIAALPVLACLLWDTVRPATPYWSSTPAGPRELAAPARAMAWPGGRGGLLAALCGLSFATFFARFAGEQGLVPVLAYDSGGLTPLTLGLATAAGTLVSLAAMPVVGRWADAGARAVLLVPAGLAAGLGLLVLPLLHLPVGFAAAIVVYSLGTGVVGVLPGVITGEAYPAEAAGAVVGLTRTAGDVGAAAGPVTVFAVAGLAGNRAACALLALLVVLAVAALVATLRRAPRKVEALPVEAVT